MKISVLSESAADEEALTILVSALLGSEIEIIEHHHLRHRGWPSVKQVLPAVIKNLHYRTEADVLIVVVDSNESRIHARDAYEIDCSQEKGKEKEAPCRICQVRTIIEESTKKTVRRSRQASFKNSHWSGCAGH